MRKGFTLAEVLIVLAVIGVIAALTIPTLMTKWQDQAIITKLKKFQSVTAQALDMAKVKQGNLDLLDWSSSGVDQNGPLMMAWFTANVAPQLKLIDSYAATNLVNYTTADGMYVTIDDFDSASILTYWGVQTSSPRPLVFTVALNSTNIPTKPTSITRDSGSLMDKDNGKTIFSFVLTAERGLVPAGIDNYSGCVNKTRMRQCTALVLEKGTTNY